MSHHNTLSLAALFVAFGAVSAGAMNAPNIASKSGFYVGGSLGAASLSNRISSYRPGTPTGDKVHISKTQFTGGLLAGYAYNMDAIHTSLELDYLFSSFKEKALTDVGRGGVPTNRYTLKARNAFGGALRLGYYVTPHALIYGRAGFEARKTKFSLIPDAGAQPWNNITKRATSTAFVPGCGLEVAVSEKVALRGEYRLALHHKKSAQGGVTVTYLKHRPRINYYLFSATYRLTDN